MKRLLCFLVVLSFAAGCQCRLTKARDIVVKINNYEITRDEFEREFRESAYGHVNTPESRREFLDNLINRKLILQDAEARGLDKEQGFLRMIEKFWEQSLLRVALDKKLKDAASQAFEPEQQSRVIDAWIADLRKKAQLDVRKDVLDPFKEGAL